MKRRLELMPEVLPDPTPHYDKGAPRNRTLAHLERLKSRVPLAATAERHDDGTITIAITGAEVLETPPPFGYGVAFVRVEGPGVLRMRALPEVRTVSLVVGNRISLKIDTTDLAVAAREITA